MTPPIDWTQWGAVLFDLDGVLTPTAGIHEQAWAALFEPYGYTHQDYLSYIDGKPRYDGVHAFLVAHGHELPWGHPADPPGDATVCALGNRKNELFGEILSSRGIAPYPGSVAVLDLLEAAGVATAVVSSSRNAGTVLAAAGLSDRFAVVVDGTRAAELGLPGKPDPATFVHAAQMLGVRPERAVVVEDAVAGVTAAVAGGFGFVLGVDRGGNAAALAAAHATAVVADLADTLPSPPPSQSAPPPDPMVTR